MFPALFVKNVHFLFDLEIDLLTLKMTLSHENNTYKKWIAWSKSHENEVLHFFLASLVEES